MQDKNKVAGFTPQIKRQSLFGSPIKVAHQFKNGFDIDEEQDEEEVKKSDQVRNNLKNLGI